MKNLVKTLIATLILSATVLADSPQIEKATVVLAEPAPSGGFQVELWTDDGATVPNTVVVPAGATQAQFLVNTRSVDTDHQINVAALSPQSSAHTGLTILPNRQAGSNP